MPDVALQVLDQQPDLIAFSAYTTNYRWCLETARRIRQLKKVIVEDCVDFVDALEHRGAAAASQVDNIVSLDAEGQIQQRPMRPLTRHLDTLPLPLPDMELFAYDYGDDYILLTSRAAATPAPSARRPSSASSTASGSSAAAASTT